MQDPTTPTPTDIARQTAQASIQELIDKDWARLEQLRVELEAAQKEYLASDKKYDQIRDEVQSLKKVIAERKQLKEKLGDVKVKLKSEATFCVA